MSRRDTYTASCQYYAYSREHGKRILFSFKVYNRNDARACLGRMRQTSGWFVERDKQTGQVVTNERINAK